LLVAKARSAEEIAVVARAYFELAQRATSLMVHRISLAIVYSLRNDERGFKIQSVSLDATMIRSMSIR